MSEPTGGASAPGRWEVVVVGGGAAGLTAAIAARHRGCSVLLLDAGSFDRPGGNARHAREVRLPVPPGKQATGLHLERFSSALRALGDAHGPDDLIGETTEGAAELARFMSAHGVRFQGPYAGVVHPDPESHFLVGGGLALVRAYRREAAQLGVVLASDAVVTGVLDRSPDSGIDGLEVVVAGRPEQLKATAVIVASGGADTIAKNGGGWQHAVVRGGAENDGSVTAMLVGLGAVIVGDDGRHAIAVDARSPHFDGGVAVGVDAVPFGILVGEDGRRFIDEGADLWSSGAARIGAAVANAPGGTAIACWDGTVEGQVMPMCWPAERAATPAELAEVLGIDPARFTETVAGYNAATSGRPVDRRILDGVATSGIVPVKSNWAAPLSVPPYYGVRVRAGVTFPFRSLGVDAAAHVVRRDGSAFPNVFAAGDSMAGSVRPSGTLPGLGLTIAGVWGRIAAKNAAGAR